MATQVKIRPDGTVGLTDVGFPNGGMLGPYGAPETVHDAAAHAAAPLAADLWSIGAMLLELLTGSTPSVEAIDDLVDDGLLAEAEVAVCDLRDEIAAAIADPSLIPTDD